MIRYEKLIKKISLYHIWVWIASKATMKLVPITHHKGQFKYLPSGAWTASIKSSTEIQPKLIQHHGQLYYTVTQKWRWISRKSLYSNMLLFEDSYRVPSVNLVELGTKLNWDILINWEPYWHGGCWSFKEGKLIFDLYPKNVAFIWLVHWRVHPCNTSLLTEFMNERMI